MSYVSSIHKFSSVKDAVSCRLDGKNWNVVVLKTNRIEIYGFEGDKLVQLGSSTVFSKVRSIKSFRPPLSTKDHLIVTVSPFSYFTVTWDPDKKQFINEVTAQPPASTFFLNKQRNPKLLIDPSNRVICSHAFQGLLTFIPITQRITKKRQKDVPSQSVQDNFTVRIMELDVLDIVFLYTSKTPTLAVLYKDSRSVIHLKAYTVNLAEKELNEDESFACHDIEEGRLIAHYDGGVFVFGEVYVYYVSREKKSSKMLVSYPVTAYSAVFQSFQNGTEVCINERKYIVSDESGAVYMFNIGNNFNVTLEKIGEAPIASCIVALPNDQIFLGSHFGDSKLYRFQNKPGVAGSVELLEVQSFDNLAPISDFCIDHGNGGSFMVACCNAYNEGSLREMKSGIDISDYGVIEMPNVCSLYSVQLQSSVTKYLFVGSISETSVFEISQSGEMDLVDSLCLEEPTIFVGATSDSSCLYHVARSSVCLFDGKQLSYWFADGGAITCAAVYDNAVCLSMTNNQIVFLHKLQVVSKLQVDSDVTALSFLNDARTICVGLWNQKLLLLDSDNTTCTVRETLEVNEKAQSLVCVKLAGIASVALYMSTESGKLITFDIDPVTKGIKQRLTYPLTAVPLNMNTFQTPNGPVLITLGEHPYAVYGENQHLSFAYIGNSDIVCLSHLQHPGIPANTVYATRNALKLSNVNMLQKLHIRRIPVAGIPRRIAATKEHYFVLSVDLQDKLASQGSSIMSSLHVFKKLTYETVLQHEFEDYEIVECALTLPDNERVVVGTGFNYPDRDEPDGGRLIVFRLDEQEKLVTEAVYKTQGAIFSVEYQEGKLLVGMNAVLCTFRYENKTLRVVGSTRTPTYCLNIAASSKDIVVVGDMMKSLTLYNTEKDTAEEVARDFGALWVTSVQPLSETLFFCTTADGEAVTMLWDTKAPQSVERKKLRWKSCYRLGDMVNRTRRGCFVLSSPSRLVKPELMCVTVEGGILLIGDASQHADLLLQIQHNFLEAVPPLGGLDFYKWHERLFPARASAANKDFIDGDLLESIEDLPESTLQKIVQGTNGGQSLNISVPDLLGIISDLKRLH
ncbi:damaged DNA binding protein Ddb1 [Schizosaccharomyces japonicus yFS275]|uniref:DNA damage-binding protein 1 n=1 Tax=Schizosaccharomyces japonicus (strain yFS275 / FY16936) TaxID=402676 RepID=B6K4A1_SCHJY|nr:damaged DNA binding protein Ddb1 [Schizosaccharomyces japonicus yFS275]EEB08308.1 damaged DNA binding protein Ddb1 [Schizosaccharomyces japonicus yFS275]